MEIKAKAKVRFRTTGGSFLKTWCQGLPCSPGAMYSAWKRPHNKPRHSVVEIEELEESIKDLMVQSCNVCWQYPFLDLEPLLINSTWFVVLPGSPSFSFFFFSLMYTTSMMCSDPWQGTLLSGPIFDCSASCLGDVDEFQYLIAATALF